MAVHRTLARWLDAGGFGLPPGELADICRWLLLKSCITCGFILAFSTLLWLIVVPGLPLPFIAGLCVLAVVLTLPLQLWLASGRALSVLIYVSFALDIAILTAAFARIHELPVLFHMQLLLVIVPCALLSPLCGMVMATLASAAHLFLVWGRWPGVSGAEILGPIYFFYMVAHQCLFYGRRLAEKTAQAETESTVAAALLRVAGELETAPTSAAVQQRLAELARDVTGAAWAGVVSRDPLRGTHRIVGLAAAAPLPDEEIKSLEFPPNAFPSDALAAADDDCLEAQSPESSFLPRWMHDHWQFGACLATPLRRAGTVIGVLLVGPSEPTGELRQPSRRLLKGMAHQAVLALDNVRLLEDVRAASALKSEFIGTMSHELRSPLHAIVGYTDILVEQADDPSPEAAAERRDMLLRVRVHSCQLRELIDATLETSRFEAGRVPVARTAADLGALLGDLRSGIPSYWRKAGVDLDWRVPAALPVVEIDQGKLKMVVRNLVHNALKFTKRGRVCVEVEVGGEPEAGGEAATELHGTSSAGNGAGTQRLAAHTTTPPGRSGPDATGNGAGARRLTIAVSDTGVGIAEHLLPVVFDMFRQGDGSDTRRHGGVGLGLYIVKRLVQALEGDIRVESELGCGSRFVLTLPLHPAGDPARP